MEETELGYDDLFSDIEENSQKGGGSGSESGPEPEVEIEIEKSSSPEQVQESFKKIKQVSTTISSTTESINKASTIAEHYNLLQPIGLKERKQSSIIRLRSFNNWLKSVLIKTYCKHHDVVLEMGVGKGGDLKKFSKSHISFLVGADIAAVSITQAQSRYDSMQPQPYKAKFFAHDCYGEVIKPKLPPNFLANLVSLQFCMHYAFESEIKTKIMLRNVSENLKLGGHLIATIPNSNFIVKKLRSVNGLEFGNSIYNIKFETKDRTKIYGDTYTFSLAEAIDDCPEYLIHMPNFIKLANRFGLQLKFKKDFHSFFEFYKTNPKFNDLLYKMNVVGDSNLPPFSNDEWEAAGLYLAVAFEKVKEPEAGLY